MPLPIVRAGSYGDAARNAFEAGNIPCSLNYASYPDSHQNDANAWGELGNVYDSQGMMLESAQSY